MECIRCNGNHIVKAGYKKLSGGSIQKYKCQNCHKFFTGEEKFHRLTSEQKDLIDKLLEEKSSQRKIARTLDVHLRTIQHHLKRTF